MSRELLKQALSALENDAMQRTFAGGVRISNAAIALRAALAAPQPEPVAWLYKHAVTGGTRIVMPDQVFTNGPNQWLMVMSLHQHPPAAPSVPAGWRLVPVEPTQEMLSALEDALNVWVQEIGEMSDVYRAMLEAAPEAPSDEGEK